jgi:hypothetical protein
MKRIVLSLLTTFAALIIFAQDKTVQDLKKDAQQDFQKDPNDTIPKIWKKGVLLNVNFNQAALSNWAAGGDKSSLALSSFFKGFAFYKKGKNSWDNSIDLAYGFVKTTSVGTRKSDDRIDILSKYGYEIAKSWYVSALLNVKSQFAKGYAYSDDNKTATLTSDFFAPGYILLAPGINYMPNDHFSVFVSPITARWIIVRNDSLASAGAYGVDSGKHSKLEPGAYATISYTHKIGTTSLYTGRLDLFSNYAHKPQDVDIAFTSLLAVNVTKVITMTFSLNMIYDNDVKTVKGDGTEGGPALQVQEILGIGLSLKF